MFVSRADPGSRGSPRNAPDERGTGSRGRMTPGRARRGAPLAMLSVVIAGWIAGRAMVWETPVVPDPGTMTASVPQEPARNRPAARSISLGSPPSPGSFAVHRTAHVLARREQIRSFDAPRAGSNFGGPPDQPWLIEPRPNRATVPSKRPEESSAAPPPFAPPFAPPLAPPLLPSTARQAHQTKPDRWSLDAWAFVREGSRAAPIGQTRTPIYGASQTGAALRYRLKPSDARDPRAFVRAYRALVPNGESELAVGLSARPLPRVPLRAVAELRATDDLGGKQLRPAAMVYTELAPVALPAGFDLEAYGGAGYVGGRADTAFADGQIVAMHEVARSGSGSAQAIALSIGAGTWGGAQRGAARLDVGPSARLDLRVGDVPARVSLDYRARVVGDAAPGSGIAATLSTRF